MENKAFTQGHEIEHFVIQYHTALSLKYLKSVMKGNP